MIDAKQASDLRMMGLYYHHPAIGPSTIWTTRPSEDMAPYFGVYAEGWLTGYFCSQKEADAAIVMVTLYLNAN